MAKPIKLTPVLKGNDAIRFHNAIKENSNKTVSGAALSEIRKSAELLRSISRIK